MNIYKCIHKKVLQALFLIGLFWFMTPTQAWAVIFANGVARTFTDVNNLREIYFGGMDSPGQPVVSGPTSLTFNTKNLPYNIVHQIYGGGRSSLNNQAGSSTVQGNTNVVIYNTQCAGVWGGGQASAGDNIVTGTTNISIHNSLVTDCSGGSTGVGAGRVQVGGVNISVDHSRVTFIFGTSLGVGLGSQNIAVKGDVNIKVLNGSNVVTLSATNFNSAAHVAGNASIFVENSKVTSVIGTLDSNIFGNLYMYLGKGTVVSTVAYFNRQGTILGDALMVIDGASLENRLIAGGDSSLRKGTVYIKNGFVNKLRVSSLVPAIQLYDMTVIVENGLVKDLEFGMLEGTLHKGLLVMNGGTINKLTIGRDQVAPYTGDSRLITANIGCGTINNLQLQTVTQESNLHFVPLGTSYIENSSSTVPGGYTNLTIEKGARTVWGAPGKNFIIRGENVSIAGELVIPRGAAVGLGVMKKLNANGGIITPVGLTKQQKKPVLVFLGNRASSLTVNSPLAVNMNFSVDCVGGNNIPFASVTQTLANPNLFQAKNRKGVVWSDTFLDKKTGVWFLTNVQISKDYYAYSAAREASNWLRQRHVSTSQQHAVNGLFEDKQGAWVEFQGGHENIDVAVGTSKMPWVMASAGYNYKHSLGEKYEALAGLSCGFASGKHKWNLSNEVKNNITIGAMSIYAGLAHESGLYGTLAAQLALSKIKTKNPGFVMDNTWRETVPTETIELGWRYAINDTFRLTPKAQIVLEHLSKHNFKLNYDHGAHDMIRLDKSTTVTTLFGVTADYTLSTTMPVDITAGIDWIKGVAGDYASKSQLFRKTFTDKNDSNVFRGTLGCMVQLSEDWKWNTQIFGDVGDDKGVGGEISFTYLF